MSEFESTDSFEVKRRSNSIRPRKLRIERHMNNLFNRSDVYVSYSYALGFEELDKLNEETIAQYTEIGINSCKDIIFDFSKNSKCLDSTSKMFIKQRELDLSNAIERYHMCGASSELLIALMCLKSELNRIAHETYRDSRVLCGNNSVSKELSKILRICFEYDMLTEDEADWILEYVSSVGISNLDKNVYKVLQDSCDKLYKIIKDELLPVDMCMIENVKNNIDRFTQDAENPNKLRSVLLAISELNKYLRMYISEEDLYVLSPEDWGSTPGEWGLSRV